MTDGYRNATHSFRPQAMDCRQFRQAHAAFVDGLMDEWRADEMYQHLHECRQCARFDTTVRRGLLVAWNLPVVRPSREFVPRLKARLSTEQSSRRTRNAASAAALWVKAASAVALIALIVVTAVHAHVREVPAPPNATGAETIPGSESSTQSGVASRFMASMVSGVPIWSGMTVADRAAAHLASVELGNQGAAP